VAIPVYLAAAWLAARLLGGRASLRSIDFWHRCIAIAALALTAVTVLEALGLQLIASDLSRPGALLGNASDQGLVAVVFALLLAVPLFRASTHSGGSMKPVLLYGGGLLGSVLTVVLSGSRGALLALAIGMALGLIIVSVRVHRQRGRRGLWAVVRVGSVAAVLTFAVVALVPGMRDRLFGLSPLSNQTVQDRFAMWEQALGIAARSPVFGVGPSGYAESVARTLDERWYRAVDPGTVLDSPHSILFQSLSSGGWPLVIIALIGTAYIAVCFARRLPRALMLDAPDHRADLVLSAGIALVGLVAGLLTHFSAASTGVLGGLLVGIVVAKPVLSRPPRWLAYAVASVLALWTLAFAVATVADYRVAAAMGAPTAVEAEREFAAALALRPWDGDVASIAAQSLTQRADFGDPAAPPLAIAWSERAMEMLPYSLAPRIANGVATRLDGRPGDAVDLLRAVREDYPESPDVGLQLAIAHLQAGQVDEGRALLIEVREVWPTEPLVVTLLEQLP
jgi:O-antigen ligase